MSISPVISQPDTVSNALNGVENIQVTFVGQAAGWFRADLEPADSPSGASPSDAATVCRVHITPTQPLPARCTLQPVALFSHRDCEFFDLNSVMGKLMFQKGETQGQTYVPFTSDPQRALQELLIVVAPTPDDSLLASPNQWRNASTVTAKLCDKAGLPWTGLTDSDISRLTSLEPWLYLIEGCALHAIAQQSTHTNSRTPGLVIEVGSLRGQSTAMLALALAGRQSDALVVSIDPHADTPSNHDQVRNTLAHIDQHHRLVQIPRTSEQAAAWIRPGSAALVFIDGDHEADAVAADFYAYAELLAPGGFLAFHDYGYGPHNGRPDVVPGVRPTVDRHVFNDDRFAPVMLAHTLMVFRKR